MTSGRLTPGRFVTLEGGEGAGKTTQSDLMEKALLTQGCAMIRTREPGGAPGAELLRRILLDGQVDWSAQAETLLHFAARAEHIAKTIRPALAAGQWVVCDRFFDSTMAYQGYGQGADKDFISAQIALLGVQPDLTIVLDVPEAVALQRVRQRGGAADRYEALDEAFHARVRAGFRAVAEADPDRCVLLEASASPQAVHMKVMAVLRERLGAP